MGITADDWMQQAVELAAKAASAEEVPVGAIVVLDQQLIGSGYNQPISSCDPTAHAEIIALRQAAQRVGNYRLAEAVLYVTLEPCLMCLGAMVQARIKQLVFGAFDPKVGAARQLLASPVWMQLNHKIDCTSGVLADACGQLLKDFFKNKRPL